jgi:endonuclease-3
MATLFRHDEPIDEALDLPNPAQRVLEIHARLCGEYGCPIAYFGDLDALSELVSSLLSHRTKNVRLQPRFQRIEATFPFVARSARCAAGRGARGNFRLHMARAKGATLARSVRQITEKCNGELSLDFMGDMPVEEARAWLETLPGVGPKTSAAVLAFSNLRRRALPVDSHHHRVAQRLGLIPASLSVGPSHRVLEAQLPTEWDAQQVYDNHEVLMLHGQRVCFHFNPACSRCVLLDLCPTGQARLKGEAA